MAINERTKLLRELRQRSGEVRAMVRTVLEAEGATSPEHLADLNPEAVEALAEMCSGYLDLEVSDPEGIGR
jgi:hypothetical protein